MMNIIITIIGVSVLTGAIMTMGMFSVIEISNLIKDFKEES